MVIKYVKFVVYAVFWTVVALFGLGFVHGMIGIRPITFVGTSWTLADLAAVVIGTYFAFTTIMNED